VTTGCPNGVWWSYILKFPTPAVCNLNFRASCSHKISASIIICMEKLNRLIANPFFLSPIRIAEGNNLLHGEEVQQRRVTMEVWWRRGEGRSWPGDDAGRRKMH
jgi:hypothetical protein